ncbi:hypothetical protein SLE2022_222000 [Rubroshorea leprosula]
MASSSNSRSSGLEASSGVRDFGLIEHTYEGREMFCECGLKAPRWTSWRPWSIGRRFYGCPNFLNADLRCAYFVWHDFELTIERATELLKLLINEKKCMSNEIAALKRQLKQRKLGGTVPVLDESPVLVESSHATSSANLQEYGQRNGVELEEIIQNAVSRAVDDVKRKMDASVSASVHSEIRKLICTSVLALGVGFVLVMFIWFLF